MKIEIEPEVPVRSSTRETKVLTKLTEFEDEIDGYYDIMVEFKEMDSGEILEALSAFTARASQIRANLIRQDNRTIQAFRTKQLDPFIEECERQFKVWSRFISVRQFEWESSRGQR
jgi:hypothetical protein